jgi:hypothetical protein
MNREEIKMKKTISFVAFVSAITMGSLTGTANTDYMDIENQYKHYDQSKAVQVIGEGYLNVEQQYHHYDNNMVCEELSYLCE